MVGKIIIGPWWPIFGSISLATGKDIVLEFSMLLWWIFYNGILLRSSDLKYEGGKYGLFSISYLLYSLRILLLYLHSLDMWQNVEFLSISVAAAPFFHQNDNCSNKIKQFFGKPINVEHFQVTPDIFVHKFMFKTALGLVKSSVYPEALMHDNEFRFDDNFRCLLFMVKCKCNLENLDLRTRMWGSKYYNMIYD